MKNNSRRSGGFTIVEVMISSSLLLLFLGGFFMAFIVGMRTLDMSVKHYRANAIARNRIQRARSFDFGSLSLLVEDEVSVDSDGNADAQGDYRRTTVVSTNTATAPYTVQLQVGVRFPLRDNTFSEQVLVETLIAERM